MKRLLIFLPVMALAVAGLRTWGQPLDRDICVYAVAGREVADGRELYSDLWDHKPPLIHTMFAAASITFGEGPLEIYMVWLLLNAVSVISLWRGAVALEGPAAGPWAGVFYVPLALSITLQANQPNGEVFLNAFLAVGFMFVAQALQREPRVRLACAGLAFGAATLVKPTAILPAAAIMIGFTIESFRAPRRLREKIIEHALAAVGIAVPWMVTMTWFAVNGRFQDLTEAVFTFNRWYGGDLWGNIGDALSSPSRMFPGFARVLLPALVLAILAATTRLRERAAGRWIVTLWLAVTPAAVAITGRVYAHYWQQWIPVLAISAALFAAGRGGPGREPAWYRTGMRRLAGAVVVLLTLVQVAPAFGHDADWWATRQHGPRAVEVRDLARVLATSYPDRAPWYQWGWETGLYFYSHRRPAAGSLYWYPMRVGPLAQKLAARTLRQLENNPPGVVVIDRALREQHPDDIVLRWILERYRPDTRGLSTSSFIVLVPMQ